MNSVQAVTSRYIPDDPKPFKAIDAVVILICLLLVFWFIRLFYQNLYQTLDSNSEQIGFVTMRINNIQRRQNDRVLWDRVRNESPVYNGDLIRVAEDSGVSFHCDGNSIELDENTMIRIFKSADGHTRIELAQGTLNLDTGENGGNISLVVGGKIIEAQAGTVLKQVSVDNENILTVAEGFAVLIDEGGNPHEAQAGAVISFSNNEIEVDTANIVLFIEEEQEETEHEEEIVTEMPSLLAAPLNMQPYNGYTLGPSRLRTTTNINFSWSDVSEANAYIFTLYEELANGRRRVIYNNTLTRANWTLSDLSVLNRGRFVWRIEAINRDAGGIIQVRGIAAESVFIVDIPVPQVELHETRNLYDQ